MKANNSLHSFKDYIESRLTKEELEQIYKEAEEEVSALEKEFKCRKCGRLDEDGMYSNAIGGWLCDSHYSELQKMIDKFMDELSHHKDCISRILNNCWHNSKICDKGDQCDRNNLYTGCSPECKVKKEEYEREEKEFNDRIIKNK